MQKCPGGDGGGGGGGRGGGGRGGEDGTEVRRNMGKGLVLNI